MTGQEEQSAREHAVHEAIVTAIQTHGFHLHYQAQNQLRTGQLVGLEVLCRLHTDALGDVSPEEFIALAEQTDLIHPLEQIVLTQVAHDLPLLYARYPQARISINVSAKHIAAPDFFPYIHQWLNALPAHIVQQLDFEITETSLQYISPQVVEGLQTMRARGARIVMDDFGSGQSSLSRLHTLPFDVIKLDKQFAQQIHHPMVHAIVKAAVEFTRQFNIGLVIEGVETPEQSHALQAIGGEVAQGFLFGKPAPLAHWLKQQ